jgi:hypothetical protein
VHTFAQNRLGGRDVRVAKLIGSEARLHADLSAREPSRSFELPGVQTIVGIERELDARMHGGK